MSTYLLSKRTAVVLMLVNITTAAIVGERFTSARRAAEHGEQALVALVNDVIRASQAQVTAERMVAIGRGYLLTVEPELLARAQAAESKLARTLQTIVAGADTQEERQQLGSLTAAAKGYRDVFGELVGRGPVRRDPKLIADNLRHRLIPARDGLVAELERLVERRSTRIEALRASFRAARTRSLDLMLGLGILGALTSLLLVWQAIGGADEPPNQKDQRRPVKFGHLKLEPTRPTSNSPTTAPSPRQLS